MTIDWNEARSFQELAELAQSADFRDDFHSLDSVPTTLIEKANSLCGRSGNSEAPDAYRFIMNVVRGRYRRETGCAIWLVEIMDVSLVNYPALAWDAAVELLRLFQPLLRERMKQGQIAESALKENSLAVIEVCYFELEASRSDVLIGALLHSGYRMVFLKNPQGVCAAIFATIREVYGYLRAAETGTARRRLDWCQSQTQFVCELNRELRETLVHTLLGNVIVALDMNDTDTSHQIVVIADQWAPTTGNARAAVQKEIGLQHKRNGELAAALRAFDAGVRLPGVDDVEILAELKSELGELRFELENAPEQIHLSEHLLGEFEGAEQALKAMRTVMVKKAKGLQVTDEENATAISQLHAWNVTAETLGVKASTRLTLAILMLGTGMSMQDVRKCPIRLEQLLAEAEKLRPAANDIQELRLNTLRRVLTSA